MMAARIRAMTGAHWIVLFTLILSAWTALYLMAVPSDLRVAGRMFGADFWRDICATTPDLAGFWRSVLMWSLMSAGMMAPTALPSFAAYDDIPGTSGRGFATLIGGYVFVWLGFAVLAAGLQIALLRMGLISPVGQSLSNVLSGLLLLGAGLYQFSALKEACLSKCRMPVMFFMEHWDEGALRNGLRLGLVCLGCCWALMMLAFVGGVMSLGFMALAMVLMFFEKLPEIGRYATIPLGVGLCVFGLGLLALEII